MAHRVLFGTLFVVTLALAVVLLLDAPAASMVISHPTIHSHVHSDVLETIRIEIMTNDPEDYRFDEDYLHRAAIGSEDNLLAFDVIAIERAGEARYQEQPMTIVALLLRIAVVPEDARITYDEAILHLHYKNGQELAVPIGEFHYLFGSSDDALAVVGLNATHETVDGINTMGGIALELRNRSDRVVVVRKIELISAGVVLNLPRRMRDRACEGAMTVAVCLGEPYSFHVPPPLTTIGDLVLPHQPYQVYVPLSYLDAHVLHRVGLVVTYDIDGEFHRLIIDDFPFIRTALYQDAFEEWYDVQILDPS